MNEKRENMIGVLVIRVPLCSHPIDISGTEVFLEEDYKKRISISHISRFLVV